MHTNDSPQETRRVFELRNLGPKCCEWLVAIGIDDEQTLREIGPAATYSELIRRGMVKPHRMLLYALAGALEDTNCRNLSASRKQELLEETEGLLS